ncbi:hypothetical protein HDU79_011086 [Rhizoclosmatium sp. JEL0117]|nr:hypothetical protein HDU79_011086 [Rhizoclosmatium sp. JEL0117]
MSSQKRTKPHNEQQASGAKSFGSKQRNAPTSIATKSFTPSKTKTTTKGTPQPMTITPFQHKVHAPNRAGNVSENSIDDLSQSAAGGSDDVVDGSADLPEVDTIMDPDLEDNEQETELDINFDHSIYENEDSVGVQASQTVGKRKRVDYVSSRSYLPFNDSNSSFSQSGETYWENYVDKSHMATIRATFQRMVIFGNAFGFITKGNGDAEGKAWLWTVFGQVMGTKALKDKLSGLPDQLITMYVTVTSTFRSHLLLKYKEVAIDSELYGVTGKTNEILALIDTKTHRFMHKYTPNDDETESFERFTNPIFIKAAARICKLAAFKRHLDKESFIRKKSLHVLAFIACLVRHNLCNKIETHDLDSKASSYAVYRMIIDNKDATGIQEGKTAFYNAMNDELKCTFTSANDDMLV